MDFQRPSLSLLLLVTLTCVSLPRADPVASAAGHRLSTGATPFLRASHLAPSRFLAEIKCSLVYQNESSPDLNWGSTSSGRGGDVSQIAVSADGTWLMTTDADASWTHAWSNADARLTMVRSESQTYPKRGLLADPTTSNEILAFSLVSPWTYIVGYQYDAATDEGTVQYRSFSSSSGEDLILDAAISTEGVIAILGESGGVHRAVLSSDRSSVESNSVFPGFERDGSLDADSVVFSPDASILYIAANHSVHATSSDGNEAARWSEAAGDSNLCAMAVSPDGLSVYALGCSFGGIHHFRLSATDGSVESTATFSTDAADVGGRDAGNAFLIEALELSVLLGRNNSDEVVLYHRDTSTGSLSDGTTLSVTEESFAVGGVVAGLSLSSISNTLYVSMAGADSTGGIVVLNVDCSIHTPAPTLVRTPSPTTAPASTPAPTLHTTPAPSLVPSPSPTTTYATPPPTPTHTPGPASVSTVPMLVEARLAAAVHGVDLLFEPASGGLGIWCRGVICSEASCEVADLLDSDTTAFAGTGASCRWKDDVTVLVTFGAGFILDENSTVTLNGNSEYITGCATCVEYSSGSAIVRARALPPVLSSTQLSKTGAQANVYFSGNPSSQEVDGTFQAVPCELVFSAASTSTLGVGSTCQFVSGFILKVSFGFAPSILPSTGESCADGDGTSLTLLAGVVRTEIGAFLTSPAGCVVVGYPAAPDAPFVAISAPTAVGRCDDLALEGSATSAPIGTNNYTWEVALVGNDQPADISNLSRLLEEASWRHELEVTVPSDAMVQGFTYAFTLRIDSTLGGSSEAALEVFKSPEVLLMSKVLGSSVIQRTRGEAITLRSETSLSSCSTIGVNEGLTSYSWTLVSANASFAGTPEAAVEVGRDPRTLVIPSHTLGYAGSSYQFQLKTAFGNELAGVANVTLEIVSGAVLAAVAGGSRRYVGASQALQLDASASVDLDEIGELSFDYTWHCENGSGGDCVSQAGDTVDMSSTSNGAELTIAAGSLPVGVEYIFTVTVSKGADGGLAWSQRRSDNASCTVSTTARDVPLVYVNPKELRPKYNPTSRLVLYGCAAASAEDRCSNRTTADFTFQWDQIDSDIEASSEESAFLTDISNPTRVVRPGALSSGRTYTFSLTATDPFGSFGYAEFSFKTNAAPIGGYVDADLLQITSGQDAVLLRTVGWVDDFEDLPLAFEFGYAAGWHDIVSVNGDLWITRLSSGTSPSSSLRTHMPPGVSTDGFNITVVAYVSDTLGSTAVTSLGANGAPLTIVSNPPEQVSLSSIRANLSSISSGGCSLVDPADSLRSAMTLTAILEYAPEPTSTGELADVLDLKEEIVICVAESYLGLGPSPASLQLGAEALAAATTSHTESGCINDTLSAEVSETLEDMIEISTEGGQVLESASAVSLLKTVSVLLNVSDAASLGAPSGADFTGKNGTLEFLSSLGYAVVKGAEAGEHVDEVSTGLVGLKAAKFAESSISGALVSIGEDGTQVSFEGWTAPEDVQDNSTFAVAVVNLRIANLEGVSGVTAINAWDTEGEAVRDLAFPVKLSRLEVDTPPSTLGRVAPTCAYWSEVGSEWREDGMMVSAVSAGAGGTSKTTCWTFHLSVFGVQEQGVSFQWVTIDQLTDADILLNYWAESWPAILFLSMVAALFLMPAMLFYGQDLKNGLENRYLDFLRNSYLDKGRCFREDQPIQVRMRERAREAHVDVNQSNQLESGYLRIHKIFRTTQGQHLFKAAVESVFMNHAWRHLWNSPAAHFRKTLLTRSQHLVILLADWMSAVTLQAIFYGKSQFSIREKAEMTAATALFMIPTALVFPALVRNANTPPSSVTVIRARMLRRQQFQGRRSLDDDDNPGNDHERRVKAQREDFQLTLAAARSNSKKPVRGSVAANATWLPESLPPTEHGKQELGATKPPSTGATPEGLSANKTAVYSDIVASQRAMVLLYLFLMLWTSVFVPMVLQAMRDAEASDEGNQNSRLHAITASLGVVCALLCVFSAYGVALHRDDIMSQAMAFQAVVAPALVLCGAILYGSNFVLATGAVIGGLGTLGCAYFLRLQRKNELVLRGVCEADLITAWAHPSSCMHSAAAVVQRAFRTHLARIRTTRAVEFNVWLNKCKRRRSVMFVLVNSVIYVVIVCLTYTNLVFAIKFDRSTCTDWLTTCVLALVVEATLQQPVVLLMTGVLGDFVEEGADFLLEVLDF